MRDEYLDPPFDLVCVGPNGTERCCSWSFVPFLHLPCFCGSMQNIGPPYRTQPESVRTLSYVVRAASLFAHACSSPEAAQLSSNQICNRPIKKWRMRAHAIFIDMIAYHTRILIFCFGLRFICLFVFARWTTRTRISQSSTPSIHLSRAGGLKKAHHAWNSRSLVPLFCGGSSRCHIVDREPFPLLVLTTGNRARKAGKSLHSRWGSTPRNRSAVRMPRDGGRAPGEVWYDVPGRVYRSYLVLFYSTAHAFG